jgi:hypothetical protein
MTKTMTTAVAVADPLTHTSHVRARAPRHAAVTIPSGASAMLDNSVFERKEKKYLITRKTYEALRQRIDRYMVVDDLYGVSHICSLYLDTHDSRMIRESIQDPLYKEKIRIRSYGVCTSFNDSVFVELKKKFNGVVYKRRVRMTAKEALSFWSARTYPASALEVWTESGEPDSLQSARNEQILRELDWTFSFYETLTPAMNVSCDRLALIGRDETDLRITFDADVRWSERDLGKLPSDGTNLLLPDDVMIMEVKFYGAVPLWLAHVLASLDILPQSFSKYGTAYKLSDRSKDIKEKLGER